MSVSFIRRAGHLLALSVIVAAILLPTDFCFSQEISPFVTAWQKLPFAKARLIAQKNSDGYLSAGLELVLDDGAHSYWRTPGEVGVPPSFSFEGSQNITDIKLDYPVPSVIDEAGSLAYGYRGHVVWPIHFGVLDKTKKVDLALFAKLAICAKICVPVEAKFTLTLNPDLPEGGMAAALSVAQANVPKLLDINKNIVIKAKAKNDNCMSANPAQQKTKILACWQMILPQQLAKTFGSPLPLFIEGPDAQWVFDTISAPAQNDDAPILIRLLQKPEDGAASLATMPIVTLTMASAPPLEMQLVLPAPPAEN